jgi:hypothetical protein
MGLSDEIKKGKDALNSYVKDMRELGTVSQETFTSISSDMGEVIKELQEGSQAAQDLTSSFKNQQTIVKELNTSAKKMAGFTAEELKNKTKLKKYLNEGQALTSKVAKLTSQMSINEIKLSRAKKAGNIELYNLLLMQNMELRNSKDTASELLNTFNEIKNANEDLNANTAVFDKMAETFSSIPALGPLIGKPIANAAKKMRELRVEGAGFGETMLSGAFDLVGSFGLPALIGLLFDADNKTHSMMRGLQISKGEAEGLKDEMHKVYEETGNSLYHVENMQEGVLGLQKELGVANVYNEDMTKNFVFMTKRLGMSEKNAGKFSKYMATTGKDSKVINLEIANAIAKQKSMTGITFKLANIMNEVAETSAGLKAAYGFDNKLLAEMVVKTKSLGINMAQAESIAASMLDFESSIAAEMEAEMLTGKELNLEEARKLAMMGKSAEAAGLVMKQMGSSADLSEMTVVQTEALAKAIGMTRNELIASVKEKEMLQDLGGKTMEQALAEANLIEDKEKREQKIEEIKKKILKHGGASILAAYEANSAQEDANAVMVEMKNKMGEMATSLVNIGRLFEFINAHADKLKYVVGVVLVGGLVSMVEKGFLFLEQMGLINAEKWRSNILDEEGNVVRQRGYIASIGHWAKKKAQMAREKLHMSDEKKKLLWEKMHNAKEWIKKKGRILFEKTWFIAKKALQLAWNATKAIGNALIKAGSFLMKKDLWIAIGQAAMGAMKSLSSIPFIGWALGLAAAGAAVAFGLTFMKDGIIGPGGNPILFGEKGAIQLDKNDSMVVGTDLGGGGGGGGSDNGEMVSLLKDISKKSTVIEMNGNAVGQGINTSEREIQ